MTSGWTAFRFAFMIVAAVLSGCAPRSGGPFQPVQIEPDKGVLYIFRPEGRRIGSAEIFINGDAAGTLAHGQFRAHILEPGEYLVRAEAGSSTVRSVKLFPGDAAYLVVHVARSGRCKLEAPDSEVGRRLIAGMRQAPAQEPAGTAAR